MTATATTTGRASTVSSTGVAGGSSSTEAAPAPRMTRQTRQRAGHADAAFDAGYREGVAAGQQDQRQNARSDFRRSRRTSAGDAGYRSSFGDRKA